jgi:hypothetical protein
MGAAYSGDMPASRPASVAALLGALLAASGCSPDRTSGAGDSPRVQRGPEVSSSRAERSLPLAAPPGDPTPSPDDSLLQLPAATVNFVGQGTTLEGCTFPNPPSTCTSVGAPPYPRGAAGPNHYVQVVNGGIAIWNKSGTLVAPSRRTNLLWSNYVGSGGNGCATQNDGQASVLYDQLADRWVLSQLSLPNLAQNASPSFMCIAVSQTNDPTGTYFLYDFQYAAVVPDYPQLGLWPDGYYASFNNLGATGPIGANICALDRTRMLAGQTATQQCFLLPSPVSGLLPATLEGTVKPASGAFGLFMNIDPGASKLNTWRLHADFATPAASALVGPYPTVVPAFSPTCGTTAACIPQPSPGNPLTAVSDRLMPPLGYRNFGTHESLVVSHSVAALASGGVRWYELRSVSGTPTIFQQGTYAPNDGGWRWMGSIVQDRVGDIALGFSLSSTTIKPSLAWTGRLASDPAGTMGQGEAVIAAGAGVETGAISFNVAADRWGAWSSMSVDPDNCTFWFTSQLYPANGVFNWDTRIAAFKFPSCATNDFALDAEPCCQFVPQGRSVDYTISTTSTAGAAESITFAVQDFPTGVTGVFTPTSVIAGHSTNLRVTASPTAPVHPSGTGAPAFHIIATSPSIVHTSGGIVLAVTDCQPVVTACPAGAECGLFYLGCAGYISCGGECPAPKTCGGGGVENVCGGMGGTGGGGGAGGGGAGGRGGVGGASGGGGAGGRGGSAGGGGRGGGGAGGVGGAAGISGGGANGVGGAGGIAGGGSGGGPTGAAGSGTGGSGATAGGAAGSSGRGGEGGATTGFAGTGGHAGRTPPSDKGCGCSTPGAPDGGAQLVGLGLACVLLVRRARRQRRASRHRTSYVIVGRTTDGIDEA